MPSLSLGTARPRLSGSESFSVGRFVTSFHSFVVYNLSYLVRPLADLEIALNTRICFASNLQNLLVAHPSRPNTHIEIVQSVSIKNIASQIIL